MMKPKSIFKTLGWISFSVFCLMTFTLLKFPTRKIQGFIDGEIASVLSGQGIQFSSAESELSLLFGVQYTMKGVTLIPPAPAAVVKIDKIELTPYLLPFLIGRTKVKVKIYQGTQELLLKASIKGGQSFSLQIETDEADLGKMGLLPLLAGVQGSVVLSGQANFSGNIEAPLEFAGDAKFTIKKITLDAQPIKGFNVPRISIQSGDIQLEADNGKLKLKTFQIGKSTNSDDLVLSGSGDIVLGKNLDSSSLNIKTQFSLSPAISKAFSLIDALLAAGKQPDGSFKYSLTGPLTSPIPSPDR